MTNLKNGLSGDPNLDMLFCTKNELKTFDFGGMKKIGQEKGPYSMNVSSKRSDIELKIWP